MPGCAKWQPGYFDKPTKIETHGRITEKTYYSGDFYKVLEVDGTRILIPDGYVEFTQYCKVKGIDAVVFTVRGRNEAPGVFVLQAHGDETILVRLCDYDSSLPLWRDAVIQPCDTGWDAIKRKRLSREIK